MKTRHAPRGQSLVEFALVLPIMLSMLGAVTDVARLYSAWITLESATRDAAEYAATNAKDSTAAGTAAQRVVCAQATKLPGFASPAGATDACTHPAVSVTAYALSTTAPGATTKNPIATVTVHTELAFTTLFPYPLFTQDGAWTLSSTRTYAIAQGR